MNIFIKNFEKYVIAIPIYFYSAPTTNFQFQMACQDEKRLYPKGMPQASAKPRVTLLKDCRAFTLIVLN